MTEVMHYRFQEIGEGRAVVTLTAGRQDAIPWSHCTATFYVVLNEDDHRYPEGTPATQL